MARRQRKRGHGPEARGKVGGLGRNEMVGSETRDLRGRGTEGRAAPLACARAALAPLPRVRLEALRRDA